VVFLHHSKPKRDRNWQLRLCYHPQLQLLNRGITGTGQQKNRKLMVLLSTACVAKSITDVPAALLSVTGRPFPAAKGNPRLAIRIRRQCQINGWHSRHSRICIHCNGRYAGDQHPHHHHCRQQQGQKSPLYFICTFYMYFYNPFSRYPSPSSIYIRYIFVTPLYFLLAPFFIPVNKLGFFLIIWFGGINTDCI